MHYKIVKKICLMIRKRINKILYKLKFMHFYDREKLIEKINDYKIAMNEVTKLSRIKPFLPYVGIKK